jgi:hypothetical protein
VHGRQADSVGVQIQMAEAALHLQTARLHAYDAVGRVDRESEAMDFLRRTQIRVQAGYAAQQVLAAINT